MKKRIYNFSPGPATLPVEVLEIVSANILSYEKSGIGVMELSHRGPEFAEIIKTAEKNLRELLNVSIDYAVIFTTGGATNQFSMVPMNFLASDTTANYIVTGYWAENAYAEAKKFGVVHLAASSKDKNFSYIPKNFQLSDKPSYLHFTNNNTIYGTQFKAEPNLPKEIPLVCDASSDLLHKRIDITKYGLVYAGAQKNLGPAGVTLVIIRKDLLERSRAELPILMNYNTYVRNSSLYNTPPTFPIYVVGEVLKWIKRSGGLDEMKRRNQKKAGLLYDVVDQSDFYIGHAEKESRSLMNIVFRLNNQSLEPAFIQEAETYGFSSLAGHRNVGGVRASIYNAFPEEDVVEFASFMRHFAEKYG